MEQTITRKEAAIGSTVRNAPDTETALQEYIEAAWRFANSVLWKGEVHSDEEERAALGELEAYFSNVDDAAAAFEQFVGTVMVAEANRKRCPILRPLQWFNRANEMGLLHFKLQPKVYDAIKKKVPLFETLVKIIARHYLEFIKYPTVRTMVQCNEELTNCGGKGWMRVFYE